MNINDIRADFPILSRKVYDKPLVYLDNAATTQKPTCVLNKIQEMYTNVNANVHRGVHFLSQAATDEHEASRKTARQFINARHAHEIIFTRGTTESINLIASSFCGKFCTSGDEILISAMEHHANIVPWQLQAEKCGVKLRIIPINKKGELQLSDLENLLSEQTKLISITHISNVLGTINPIEKIIEIAHRHDIPVMIDAAQSVQHIAIDVQKLDCDFLAFSGHKLYAPTGIGVLYGKEKWLEQLPPYQGGGEMISKVTFDKTTFNELPFKFEAGTPDFVGSTALAVAMNYVQSLGLENIRDYENQLLAYATEQLSAIDKLKIFGTSKQKSSVISFLVGNIHHYDLGTLLDRMGIAIRTGHHCAQPLMNFFGIEGTMRASFAFYNTFEEVDALVAAIKKAVKLF